MVKIKVGVFSFLVVIILGLLCMTKKRKVPIKPVIVSYKMNNSSESKDNTHITSCTSNSSILMHTPITYKNNTDIHSDPEIKTIQSVSYDNGNYELTTFGWNHHDIVYTNTIEGNFAFIKSHKLLEKKKSDNVIYSKEVQKLKELK